MFTMQTRQTFAADTYSTIEGAIAAGMALGMAFDVSARSGALVWVWEMRP